MKNTTPMFPDFHLQTLRRKPRSAQQKLADELARLKQKSAKQIGELFEKFIPHSLLDQEQTGVMSRRRIFSKENTFWAFFSQILDADGGCKEVVRKLQAYISVKGNRMPSSSTASYCTARKKLDEEMLSEILEYTVEPLAKEPASGILNNRRIVVVDGTGVSMPDTRANQEVWPQSSILKAGCSFPVAHICACFSLQSGGLLSYEIGNKKDHELPMLRKQWQTFKEGDILLADKLFCSYFDIDALKKRKVDSVVTLSKRLPVSAKGCKKKLGEDDLLISWKRPKYNKKSSYSRAQLEELPEELELRQIKVEIQYSGFRKQNFYIVTTLLDAVQYPPEELAELYFQRWDVELFFRDLKTTMNMDILRCQSPEMIRKEILMHFIAYNCIRRLMCEAAKTANTNVRFVSFKGSLQALRNWEPHISQDRLKRTEQLRLISDLYHAITDVPIRQRPGRSEPRCVKRRPKNYQRLTASRHEMKECPHRSKYRAEAS